MTAQGKIKDGDKVEGLTGLDLLRAPFPPHQISKLPKPTKRQTEEVRADFKKGVRCKICGAWHHPQVVHLDYVGHAALTDRLLDCDPQWNWEPVATNEDGTPRTDENGGMWIRLTVCGVTRLGYGHPDGKRGGDAVKEVIGDCLITGTMITTARGDVPIESVRVGDLVPTRSGWRHVIDHWRSAPSAPVVRVLLSNGRQVTGTPHHKVPTVTGEKRLSALRNGDTMHIWQDTENYPEPRKSNGAVDAIVGTRRTSPSIAADISWQQPIQEPTCTETFTRQMDEPSQMGGTFITMMKTGTTIALKILSRYRQELTHAFMQSLELASTSDVKSAAGYLSPPFGARSGVHLHVKRNIAAATALPTSSQKNQRPNENCDALSVAKNSNRLNRGRGFAQAHVVEVSDAGLGEVWNLSVEGVHEYVANGILVHNCLRNAAMRFGAALDLWHKGDLHAIEGADESKPEEAGNAPPPQNDAPTPRQIADRIITDVNKAKGDKAKLTDIWERSKDARLNLPDDLREEVKAKFAAAPQATPDNADLGGDEIPF